MIGHSKNGIKDTIKEMRHEIHAPHTTRIIIAVATAVAVLSLGMCMMISPALSPASSINDPVTRGAASAFDVAPADGTSSGTHPESPSIEPAPIY